ncbi:MAG: cupredoxin domain-containing protein [Deltaproteobacteria bacterium]|nr:cupredoxin domain-containing protein [Deltaproteobacteria bacterium]
MQRKSLWLGFFFAAATALALSTGGYCAESQVMKDFTAALEQNDPVKAAAVIDANKDKVPGEIKALLDEAAAPGLSKEDVDGKYYIAELMAKLYKDSTGDIEPLKTVKKKSFDSKLSPAVRSTAVNGVHVVECPEPAGEMKNFFKPDNIIIKKDETVRWVNNDKDGHIFASMPFIGMGGIFSPKVEHGQSWEFKFEKPGEYFYICFIHQRMMGKVTVEE